MTQQTTDPQYSQILEKIRRLEETVQQLQQKIAQQETQQTHPQPRTEQTEARTETRTEHAPPNSQAILEIDFMNLSDSLRKTMLAIARLREATPEEIAKETNRTRGLENIYLNQLERLGYVEKIKKGKRVYFRSLRII